MTYAEFMATSCDHEWEQLHHTDIEGRHFCPTGYEMCYRCGDVRVLPDDDPGECRLWNEFPDDMRRS